MMHPSIPADAKLWTGRDVESSACSECVFLAGRLCVTKLRLLVRRVRLGIHQLVLTESFSDWAWFETDLLPHLEGMVDGITVIRAGSQQSISEVLSLPYAKRLRIRVRVPLGELWVKMLRAHDEISVGVDYRNITFSRSAGVFADPSDYEEDVLP